MQNLEAYQKLELEKQLGKIQITTAFQNYIKKTLSICLSQQAILQNAGINPATFFGVTQNGRLNILQPSYFDPATMFGPAVALLNTMIPQIEGGTVNQSQNSGIQQSNVQPTMSSNQLFLTSTQSLPTPSQSSLSFFSNRVSEPSMKMEGIEKDGLLSEFFERRISETSTKFASNQRAEDEIDTGKKIRTEPEVNLDTQARPKSKVLCGHTERVHHAKGLCKNCYETYGKTRKPWKCQHETHFAKGYCKKCYLRVRLQQVMVAKREGCPYEIMCTQVSEKEKKAKEEKMKAENEKNNQKEAEDTPTKAESSTKIEAVE